MRPNIISAKPFITIAKDKFETLECVNKRTYIQPKRYQNCKKNINKKKKKKISFKSYETKDQFKFK